MIRITNAPRILAAAYGFIIIAASASAQSLSLEWFPLEAVAWNASSDSFSVVGELHPSQESMMLGGDFALIASFLIGENSEPVTANPRPQLHSLVLSNGQVRFGILGVAALTVRVERALSPVGPWVCVGSAALDERGAGEFLDENPPQAAAFYRTK